MNVRYRIAIVCLAGFWAVVAADVSLANEIQRSDMEQSNLGKALYCIDILEDRSDIVPS
jgi:hypothetical protein